MKQLSWPEAVRLMLQGLVPYGYLFYRRRRYVVYVLPAADAWIACSEDFSTVFRLDEADLDRVREAGSWGRTHEMHDRGDREDSDAQRQEKC